METSQYILNAVDGFENLYGEELIEQQRRNLVEAFKFGEISLGVDADFVKDAFMAWGDYTRLTDEMLDDWQVIERLLLAYDGDHKDLDAYIRELYNRYFNVDDAQALRFVDTKAFKDDLEYWGWCFAPSLDGTVYHVFND